MMQGTGVPIALPTIPVAITAAGSTIAIGLMLWQGAAIASDGVGLAWWATTCLALALATAAHGSVRYRDAASRPAAVLPLPVPATRSTAAQCERQLLRDFAADVRRAIADGEFRPYYQPMVDLRSGLIVGFECLARWCHPERGLIKPDQFIGAVERAGMIEQMSVALLGQACRDAATWPANLTLSFNISPTQLCGKGGAARWLRIAHDRGFDPRRLIVEVTEQEAIADAGRARRALAVLRRAGVQVMLDDLGAGFAARHLCEIAFNAIKIDRDLVQRAHALESGNIVEAIIAWSEASGLPVIAEGIETPDHARALRALGCEFGQGYLFSEPVPANDAWQLAWAAA
jgi:EAL domain-containing protein (putative c-di-GMP-specific phosphodiesterase class I)